MKKQLIIATLASTSVLALPVIAQAHRAANHGTDVRNEHAEVVAEQHRQNDDTPHNNPTIDQTPAGTVLSTTTSVDTTTTDTALTLEEAIAKAKELFPDKTVQKTETESEHGTVEYEIKFTDGSKVEIDAESGKVLESKDAALSEDKKHNDEHEDEEHHSESGR